MAIYFIQAFLIMFAGAVIPVNKSDKYKRRFIFFAFGLLILVAALRSPDVGKDLAGHYAINYENIADYSWGNIPVFSASTGYALGYCYFTKFLTIISADVQFYIVVTSCIIYGVLGWFIYRNSVDVRMSTYLLIFTCTYYMFMNIVRQALAIAVILIGYEILKGKDKKILRYIAFAIIVVIASTIHSSAILCLCMILFDILKFKRKHIIIGIGATAIFYVAYIQIYTFVIRFVSGSSDYSRYLSSESAEYSGNFNLQSIYMLMTILLAFILGYVFIVMKSRRREREVELNGTFITNDDFLMYMGLLASIFRFMVFRMNILNRLSWFFIPFVFLLYPRAIQNMSLASNRKVTRSFVYIFMIIYFVWMTFVYEETFHGTVPYVFFWNQ